MAQLQAAGDGLAEGAEGEAHGLAERLERLEARRPPGSVDAQALGRGVVDGDEDRGLALARHGGGQVFKGALIKRTTNVTIPSNVLTTLGWESEVYDTDGFADVAAQPTRLTIPAGKGITRVQVLCGV